MYRQNNYTQGNFFRAVPVSRQPVVPGQSLALDLKLEFETPAFLRNLLTGGMAEVYSFYVPYRLLWNGWVDFISDPQSADAVPTTAVAMPSIFENVSSVGEQDDFNVFARRAYKLIYNQYFGSEQFGGAGAFWYDLTDDAETTQKPVRTNDQLLGKIMGASQSPDTDYTVDVAGVDPNQTVSIPLNDFRRAMNIAKSDRRADMTGDKYVDAMRRMGVNLNWAIQMAPEFLGKSMIEFGPKETRASYSSAEPAPDGSAATGRAYARFSEKVNHKTGRKFFAEHGIVMSVLVVRPFIWYGRFTAPQDSFAVNRENFFLGDNQAGIASLDLKNFGQDPAPIYAPRFQSLLSGMNQLGVIEAANPNWVVSGSPVSLSEMIYPTVTVQQDPILTQDFAVYARHVGLGPTPVRKSVL